MHQANRRRRDNASIPNTIKISRGPCRSSQMKPARFSYDHILGSMVYDLGGLCSFVLCVLDKRMCAVAVGGSRLDLGLAGVDLSRSLSLTSILPTGVGSEVHCENVLTSVERVCITTSETLLKTPAVAFNNQCDLSWRLNREMGLSNALLK